MSDFISGFQYENCLKKFFMYHKTDVLMYLARAYYKAGKLKECKITLEKVKKSYEILIFHGDLEQNLNDLFSFPIMYL